MPIYPSKTKVSVQIQLRVGGLWSVCALKQFLRDWIKKAPPHFSTVSRNISLSLPAIFAAYRNFFSQEILKLTANNQSILYFKRSEEGKLLFPLSSKVTFIIIGESAFLYHYLF